MAIVENEASDWNEVIIKMGGEEVQVVLEKSTIKMLQSDHALAARIFHSVQTSRGSTASAAEDSGDIVKGVEWSREATLMLIDMYGSMKDKFNDPRLWKKDVWAEIADKMQQCHFNVSGSSCSKKWHNMQTRYNMNLESGRKGSRLEYFERMQEVCGDLESSKFYRRKKLAKQLMVSDSTESTPLSVQSCVLPRFVVSLDSDNNENDAVVNDIEASFGVHDYAEDPGYGWSRESTLLLLDTVDNMKEKFGDPFMRKRELWEEVAAKLQESEHNVPPPLCSKKWHNMQLRYKMIRDNKGQKKSRRNKAWPYFERVHQVCEGLATAKAMSSQKRSLDPNALTSGFQSSAGNPNVSANADTDRDGNETSVENVVAPSSSKDSDGILSRAWSTNATLFLIDVFESFKDKFNGPPYNKRQLWNEVGRIVRKRHPDKSTADCTKKWSNMLLRYKMYLVNLAANKAGHWKYFERMHQVCKDLTSVTTYLRRQQIGSNSDSNAVNANAAAGVNKGLVACCCVSHSIGRQDKVPQWLIDAEARLRYDQVEWRKELRERMDKQEALQAEQLAVQRQTNELLKSLVNDCSKLVNFVSPMSLGE